MIYRLYIKVLISLTPVLEVISIVCSYTLSKCHMILLVKCTVLPQNGY